MDKQVRRIVGVFETEEDAIAAIEDLLQRGCRKDEISVIGKYHPDVDDVNRETGTAVKGAITGGALGGVIGLLAGAGVLAAPGLGPIVAAGPIAGTILGTLTGAGLGRLAGAIVGMGISDDEAKYYEKSVKDGKILVIIEIKLDDNRNNWNYIYDVDHELSQPFKLRHDEGRIHRIAEVVPSKNPVPGSGFKSRVFGSAIEEDLPLEKDSSLESDSSVEKGSSLKEANNSSMAQDYEEMKRLGNEMEQNKTGQELREDNLKPDPIQ